MATFHNGGNTDDNFFVDDEPGFDISVAARNVSLIVAGHSSLSSPMVFDRIVMRLSNDLIFSDDFE